MTLNRNKKTWHMMWLIPLLILVMACDRKPASETPAQQQAQAQAPTPIPVQKVSEEIKSVYQWYCAQCHGVEGKGDGINARLLTVMPRNHTEAEYLETRSDEELFRAIKLGGVAVGRAPCMPKWGHTLDDEIIRGLVLYVRELCQCKGS